MENHASNPAGRLWLYFSEMSLKQQNQPVSNYAAAYFGSKGRDAKYMLAMGRLMQLPDEVAAMVARLEQPPIPVSKLIRPLDAVRGVFDGDPLATNPVSWMRSVIDGGVLSDLETTSHILSSYATNVSDIREDTLSQIKALAEEVIEMALNDDALDPEARAAIIRHAHRIIVAVDLYKVSGPEGLVDELDRFYSEVRRVRPTPSLPLRAKLGKLLGVIVIATELFSAPVSVANAIDYYGETFELSQLVEAPGESADVVIAEVVIDDQVDQL
ncbi:hypothetical protein [Microbacterium murale]|uniref:Uncharacterized protein n=1 Tax=Microbacterium murale TaxID=1081040 RepID=A0ABU0PG85_9MICO|nr:hypothetical protein [Microbacterium murale]MDQ0645669.1 hypothetical protein [Microbacterium murale]